MARAYEVRDGEACFVYPSVAEAKEAAYRVYSEGDVGDVRTTEGPDGTALVRVPAVHAAAVAALLG